MSRNAAFDAEIDLLKVVFTKDIPFDEFDFYEPLKNSLSRTRAIEILVQMQAVYEAKDTDYASNGKPMGNLRSSEDVGVPAWKGVLIRVGDKVRRIASFMERGEFKVADEKLVDTLQDLANYALLGVVLLAEIPVPLDKHEDFDRNEYLDRNEDQNEYLGPNAKERFDTIFAFRQLAREAIMIITFQDDLDKIVALQDVLDKIAKIRTENHWACAYAYFERVAKYARYN